MALSKKFFNKQFVQITLAIMASVLVVAGFVYGATTIGTNISVDGNLAISGTSATSTFSTGGFTVGTNQFVVQQTSGKIGIGTTSPSAKLSLAGNGYFDSNLIAFGSSTASSLQLAFQHAATTTIPQTANGWSLATSTTGDSLLSVNGNNGQVGIGRVNDSFIGFSPILSLADPTGNNTDLHILTIGGNPPAIIMSSMRGTFVAPVASAIGDLGGDILFTVHNGVFPGNQIAEIFSAVEGATTTNTRMPGYLVFATTPAGSGSTAATERVRITSLGNVGIGTTSPTKLLSVVGDTYIAGTGTTTLNLKTTTASKGTCIEMFDSGGAVNRLYVNPDHTLKIEAGTCK